MSVKTSARIKKRRSAEAAAFGAVSAANQGNSSTSNSNTNHSAGSVGNASAGGGCGSGSSSSGIKKHGPVGRNPNFDTDETKLLIQLWGDPKLQRTLITTHKKHAVICQLAAKMQEYGYHRSPEEITTRIKNLKCFYNRLKKDMESGLAGETEPSWKHFAEMDAIMTRPIFSVRPNEVPAPSLKYQMEQALEEHAERRKRRLENGDELSDSENEEDDMLLSALVPKDNGKVGTATGTGSATKNDSDGCIMPDVEVEMDISEETFAAITSVATNDKNGTKRCKYSAGVAAEVDLEESLTARIKTEPGTQKEQAKHLETNTGTTDEDDDDCMVLTLPKEEPIDVDADDDRDEKRNVIARVSPSESSSNVRAAMPTLADMLQLPKGANLLPLNGANVIIPAASLSSNTTIPSPNSSSTASKVSPGKISLVPTNFLMQPKLPGVPTPTGVGANVAKAPQIQLLQSALNNGARLMLSGGTTAHAQTANTGIVSSSASGVKVYLVNADQAAAAKAAATVGKPPVAALPMAASLQQPQQPQLQQQQMVQQQQLHQQEQQQQKQEQQNKKDEKRRAQEKAREEQQTKRHMTTMRILLRQLLNAQNEANEIQHNRLSLERERLDWEKSMGDRLFTLLPTLFPPAPTTNAAPHHPQTHQQPQFIVSGATSATQRLQPPKLLFTTALPMANGTVSMPHILTPSGTLTASLPKVIAAPAQGNSNNVSGTAVGCVNPVEICTQINDIQLVTPKMEKEG